MSNINARIRLERLSAEISRVREHVVQHSDVSAKDALMIDNLCGEMIQDVARIAQEARRVMGDTSHKSLIKSVRKALGFTQP